MLCRIMLHTMGNTATGAPAGTFAYAAPEMLLGEKWNEKVSTPAFLLLARHSALVIATLGTCCVCLSSTLNPASVLGRPEPLRRACQPTSGNGQALSTECVKC